MFNEFESFEKLRKEFKLDSFMEKELFWVSACRIYTFPEEFIREFADYVIWDIISITHRDLSVDFLREFKDKFPNIVIEDEMNQDEREEHEMWNKVMERWKDE